MEINNSNVIKNLLFILNFLNLLPKSGFGIIEFKIQDGKIVHTRKIEDIRI